jgi:hypothetical protein
MCNGPDAHYLGVKKTYTFCWKIWCKEGFGERNMKIVLRDSDEYGSILIK